MTETDEVTVALSDLVDWTRQVLSVAGLNAEDAELAARTLVLADARGFKTHGLARLRSYVDMIADGEIAPRAALKFRRRGSLCVIDANGALGQVVGPRAVDEAVELARQEPVVVCKLNNVAHLGALGIPLLRAAEAGMVGLMFQATPPVMALPGAARPVIGNNPMAMAAPRPNGPPILVDMSCSVAARGNLLIAARAGESIPEGWALDRHGQPTTDPQEALMGSLLPFGQQKGLVLATVVEVLAGSLMGAHYQATLEQDGGRRSGTTDMSGLILVLNPDLVTGRKEYERHITDWTSNYVANGGPDARLPGQQAHERQITAETSGVALARPIATELGALGDRSNTPFPVAV